MQVVKQVEAKVTIELSVIEFEVLQIELQEQSDKGTTSNSKIVNSFLNLEPLEMYSTEINALRLERINEMIEFNNEMIKSSKEA
ncbi:hypothetical protein [Tenacibaculum finnmarkense]|uniref:hypothetical protein n=1 Tax=Tenacibaculum finnmarkense TaxID=2781243 RepID=UPI00187B3777|nr:hypothetical protein [Tenacibaculum finnmarkense]MBE7691521.1 hypothetical protein [Tenacibaculum finnmarkense genomovar finnmarkense]